MMQEDQRPSLCLEFLGWQCRVRQDAMRHHGGRPPEGIRAQVNVEGEFAGEVVTVMNRLDPEQTTAEFRFIVQKTHDPQAVYKNGLATLCEQYYQTPVLFDDRLTALFSLDNQLAKRLLTTGQCELVFIQKSRRYRLFSMVYDCHPGSTEYEATYWHNHLFNPHLPGKVQVLLFQTDWDQSKSAGR